MEEEKLFKTRMYDMTELEVFYSKRGEQIIINKVLFRGIDILRVVSREEHLNFEIEIHRQSVFEAEKKHEEWVRSRKLVG